jgi:hypothetical protein
MMRMMKELTALSKEMDGKTKEEIEEMAKKKKAIPGKDLI